MSGAGAAFSGHAWCTTWKDRRIHRNGTGEASAMSRCMQGRMSIIELGEDGKVEM